MNLYPPRTDKQYDVTGAWKKMLKGKKSRLSAPGSGKVALSVKCLLLKLEDPSSGPEKPVLLFMLPMPAPGRQEDLWHLLASETGLLGEL